MTKRNVIFLLMGIALLISVVAFFNWWPDDLAENNPVYAVFGFLIVAWLIERLD